MTGRMVLFRIHLRIVVLGAFHRIAVPLYACSILVPGMATREFPERNYYLFPLTEARGLERQGHRVSVFTASTRLVI